MAASAAIDWAFAAGPPYAVSVAVFVKVVAVVDDDLAQWNGQ